jgi:L-ascorbate metabolism protein UlaG (beta-lactamase superfamily)
MKFTYYGHSSFLIETGSHKLLFDPYITPNPLAAAIDIDAIEADFILLSHGHADHVADVVSIAKRTGAKVICAYEIMIWLNKQGIENVHPMNTGGRFNFDFGSVKCTAAQHSSSMPDGSYGGNPMGFIVYSGEGNFYYSGDTALTLDMQLIPGWADLQFAILPIGDNFTMGIDDAATAAGFVKTNTVIGVHYDTFGYIVIDKAAAKKTFEAQGIALLLPGIGETVNPIPEEQ